MPRRACANGCDKPVHADGLCNTCYARTLRAGTTRTVRSDEPCGKCGQVHTRCTSHRNSRHKTDPGGPCGQHPRPGLTVCRTHGASAPHVKAAGERRVAQQEARALAARWAIPIETTPVDAILGRVSAFAGHVKFYGDKVAELAEDDLAWGVTKESDDSVVVGNGPGAHVQDVTKRTREAAPNVWLALYNEASDKLVKFAAEALRAGVQERVIRLAEQEGRLLAQVIRGVLADLRLTPDQEALVGEVVPRHLRAVGE